MKIYLEILLLIIVVVISAYLFFYFTDAVLSPSTPQNSQNQVCFGEHCFSVELAKTNSAREKGLMDRTQLGQNNGMLFIFDNEDIYPFWMKNTLILLDIIWIDSNYKVVFISQDAQPCRSIICPAISPLVKAKYVLEINSGISKEIGLKIGDTAKLELK